MRKERPLKTYTGYEHPLWAVDYFWRMSGLLEDVCEHGVGHPNRDFLKEKSPEAAEIWGVHGCDGCCSKGLLGSLNNE